ncbi:MAG TPA: hypothetical protein VKU84_05970 [Stellaceae bacterium]|nr:hypothetical protein [Stellaceae bacterium]
MIRAIVLIVLLAPAIAFAQAPSPSHMGGDAAAPMPMPMHQGAAPMSMHHQMTRGSAPTESGQAAFAAIQEIVGILEADPKTDWSKVNIEALRQHLIDMNNVTLAARVASEPVKGGMRYTVTGDGPVQDSIRRMVTAHAAAMDGIDGWRFEAASADGGAVLTVRPPAKDMEKLRGLGFIGVLVRGMHHQMHHLMIARGEAPHE